MAYVCSPAGWSAVTSAVANATLAGVLAGFMLNGIVVLLSRQPGTRQRGGYVKGSALLFTAFVALGLDSYLFGLVTGDGTAHACRRAWTEAMFAAGLLGLGAVAVVAGIVFLLGVFFSDPTAKDNPDDAMVKSMNMLATLCVLLRPGVALVVILLLAVTARSYLFAIFPHGMPTWANDVFWAALVLDIGIFVAFILVYLWGTGTFGDEPERVTDQDTAAGATMLDRVFNWLWPDLEKHQQFAFAARLKFLNGILNLIWSSLNPDAAGEVTTLKATVYSSLVYSLVSVIAATLTVLPSVRAWNSASLWVTVSISATIVWVLVVSLIPLGALLAPSFGPKKTATAQDLAPADSPVPGTTIPGLD